MADYSKWKVTELKAELKRRGVPQTGLKLKQDFINKLIELDSEAREEPSPEDVAPQPPSGQGEDKNSKDAETAKAKPDEPAVPEPATEVEIQQTPDASATQNIGQGQVAADSRSVSERNDDVAKGDHNELQQTEQPVAPQSGGEALEMIESAKPGDDESRDTGDARSNEIAAETPMAVEASSSVPSELENEMRKRKRRSNSPPPTDDTTKKSRVDNKSPRVVLREDVSSGTATPSAAASTQRPPVEAEQVKEKEEGARRPSRSDLQEKEDISAERRDRRFGELLPPIERKRTPSPGPPAGDDHEVEPALHPATPAIYIRGLMRPLQPASLKRYLVSLASANNDPEFLLDFFLDPIKTHCFAVFNSVSAASHVRSKLHGNRWPNERDRKPLWADFIPEDKVSEWIKTEESASQGGRAGPRWEVVYEQTENGYRASLQEFRGAPTGPASARRQSGEPGLQRDSQPMGRSPPPPAPAPALPRERVGEGFKALDERFLSTQSKPKLYYLPVPRDVIDKRLDRFAALSRKGAQHRRSGGDETRRITFEDVDVFVDDGPEYGFARNRGGRRTGRGAWRGRAR